MTGRLIPALVALLAAGAVCAGGPPVVEYVYVEANEGGSSGGHAALRLGDDVYHFQHEHGGLLRLHRDDWRAFLDGYGVLQNRTMHLRRIAVPADAAERLRRRFSERYLIERRLFAHRDTLRDDRELLERFLAVRHGDAAAVLPLRGAGLFFPEVPGAAPDDALEALRRRVQAMYGADAVPRRMAVVARDLRALPLPAPDAPDSEVPADGYPRFGYPFSRRYRDLVTALAALTVLERGLPLRAEACWPAMPAAPGLAGAERRALAGAAAELADELTRLFASDRPDWGFAFLVGMARLAAVRASEASGRLVLLDAFPRDAEVVSHGYLGRHPEAVASMVAAADAEFARARARFADREGDLPALEAAGNRLLELRAAAAEERDLRVAGSGLIPARDGPWTVLVVPDAADADLAHRLVRAGAVEQAFAGALAERYGYNLVTRNCVSEIFRTVDAAGVDLAPGIGTGWSMAFVPFVSARAVDAAWPVAEQVTLRSYRRARLDDMRRTEHPLRVWLREGNVFSATVYRRNPDDSVFVLFTDDVVTPRPVLGACNLVAGLGAAAAGVALLPFDGGHTLLEGLRGAVFSLPELAFVSLRKGSFDRLPPDALGGRPETKSWVGLLESELGSDERAVVAVEGDREGEHVGEPAPHAQHAAADPGERAGEHAGDVRARRVARIAGRAAAAVLDDLRRQAGDDVHDAPGQLPEGTRNVGVVGAGG